MSHSFSSFLEYISLIVSTTLSILSTLPVAAALSSTSRATLVAPYYFHVYSKVIVLRHYKSGLQTLRLCFCYLLAWSRKLAI